jgi:hypothetical protein
LQYQLDIARNLSGSLFKNNSNLQNFVSTQKKVIENQNNANLALNNSKLKDSVTELLQNVSALENKLNSTKNGNDAKLQNFVNICNNFNSSFENGNISECISFLNKAVFAFKDMNNTGSLPTNSSNQSNSSSSTNSSKSDPKVIGCAEDQTALTFQILSGALGALSLITLVLAVYCCKKQKELTNQTKNGNKKNDQQGDEEQESGKNEAEKQTVVFEAVMGKYGMTFFNQNKQGVKPNAQIDNITSKVTQLKLEEGELQK